ncbi:MAG: hypothetical protein Q8L67_05660, partial [Hydrogenophaga sp.]|nr:hypothetical protein [Hydrogenophaga sp.]
LWSGQGDIVDTVRYVDTTDMPQPWPWVPRYWHASDMPELQAAAPVAHPITAPTAPPPAKKPKATGPRATRKPKP